MQKRVIRIMMGCSNRDSGRDLFKKLKILPLKSQYIFPLLIFVVKDCFIMNIESPDIFTSKEIIYVFLKQT
jgi:hypothetical protein